MNATFKRQVAYAKALPRSQYSTHVDRSFNYATKQGNKLNKIYKSNTSAVQRQRIQQKARPALRRFQRKVRAGITKAKRKGTNVVRHGEHVAKHITNIAKKAAVTTAFIKSLPSDLRYSRAGLYAKRAAEAITEGVEMIAPYAEGAAELAPLIIL